jgi:lipopolysaccharide export system permease protein
VRRSLDGYVARIVASSWLAVLLSFMLLYVLVDLVNSLPSYLDRADEEGVGLFGMPAFFCRVYIPQLPTIFLTIAPFVTVIACMFSVARLMAANEVVPMLFVGRSMSRVLRPVLIAGVLAGLGMVACWQWLVPTVREAVQSRAPTRLQDSGSPVVIEIHGDISHFLYIKKYHASERRMEGVMLLLEEKRPGGTELIQAKGATWDDKHGDWRLVAGTARRGSVEKTRAFMGEPKITPERVWQQGKEDLELDDLSYSELMEMERLRPNRLDVRVAFLRHFTYPLANVILLLLALPFAVYFERGSRIERVISAIGVCGAYLVVDLICQNLGRNGALHPVVAAWSPTILFGSLGVAMFTGIRT